MKIPNWFKIIWWVLLMCSLTYFLYQRYPDLIAGKSSYADVFVFLILVALSLTPLFQEVSFFGMSFKKEIETLKKDVKGELAEIRNDIQNSIEVKNQFNPNIMFGTPPEDSQLPAIEEKIRDVLNEITSTHSLRMQEKSNETLNIDDDVSYLFSVRYNIEKELRRIWSDRHGEENQKRPVPLGKLSRLLTQEELVDPRIVGAIGEILSIASPAIHGNSVTKAQIAFVKYIAPSLIDVLSSV